jgi:hypothetical protein
MNAGKNAMAKMNAVKYCGTRASAEPSPNGPL